MGLEAATYINELVATNPVVGDDVAQGDDHIRLLKTVLQSTFPGLAGRFGRIQSKAANYTVTTTDNTSLLVSTASLVFTLDAASTIGNGFVSYLYNSTDAFVTVTPSGSDLINGFNSFNLYPRQIVTIYCDGVSFLTESNVESKNNPLLNSNMGIWGKKIDGITCSSGNTPIFGPVGYRVDVSAASAMMIMARSTVVPSVSESGIFPLYSVNLVNQLAKAAFGASEYEFFSGVIEGYDSLPFIQNPFNLAFWVRSSQTGTYNISLTNSGNDQSYVKSFSISSVNAWEFKRFRIPASPSGGTWDYTSGVGLRVRIALGVGSSFTVSTDNAWTAVNALASTSNVNFNAIVSASINFTAMHMWKGDQFKIWEYEGIEKEALRCNRQYFKTFSRDQTATVSNGTAGAFVAMLDTTGIYVGGPFAWPVEMRAVPTVTKFNPVASNSLARLSDGTNLTLSDILVSSKFLSFVADSAPGNNWVMSVHLVADARL